MLLINRILTMCPCCPGPLLISIKGAGKFEWCHGLNSNECAILIWGSWFGTLSSLRKMPVQRAIVWVCGALPEQKNKNGPPWVHVYEQQT